MLTRVHADLAPAARRPHRSPVLVALALIAFATAGILALAPVRAYGVSCGSALLPTSVSVLDAAHVYLSAQGGLSSVRAARRDGHPSLSAACADQRSRYVPGALIAGMAGGALLIAALTARRRAAGATAE